MRWNLQLSTVLYSPIALSTLERVCSLLSQLTRDRTLIAKVAVAAASRFCFQVTGLTGSWSMVKMVQVEGQ